MMLGQPWILLAFHASVVAGLGLIVSLHFCGVRWYYRLGFPLLSEEWQTTSTEAAVRKEFDCFAQDGKIGRYVVYHWSDGLGFRLKSSKHTNLSRATVTTKTTQSGALLVYQAHVSIAYPALLVVMNCVLALQSRNHMDLQWTFWIFASLAILSGYLGFFRITTAIRELDRLPELRRQLQHFGVHVCDNCGYDLFQRASPCKCPECGMMVSLSPFTSEPEIRDAKRPSFDKAV